MLSTIITVVRYELRRALNPLRMLMGGLLVMFPVGLVYCARSLGGPLPLEFAAFVSCMLIPQMLVLLSLLRSAVPMIQSEVEAQSWIYLALRPRGKESLVIGKYLVAVALSILGGLVATVACSPIIVDPPNVLPYIVNLSGLVVLSSAAYGAMYTLIGVAIQRRAMVVAVAYTLGVEVIISLLPATINQLTVSFRLRSLLLEWFQLPVDPELQALFGHETSLTHIIKLLIYTLILLGMAVAVIRVRQLPVQGES